MINYDTSYTLSDHWIIRHDPQLYPEYLAYDIYLDKKIMLSPSLYYILDIFKYNKLSMNELLEVVGEKYKAEELFEILFNNKSLPGILASEGHFVERDHNFDKVSNTYNIPIADMPLEAEIHFTEKCNLTCRHCAYSCDRISKKQELSFENWIDLFNQFEESDMLRIIISGGEPFLYKDIKHILSDLSKRKLRVEILTNGTLIKNEHIKYLVCAHISLSISLDSVVKEHHEYLRGSNTFDKTIKTIKCLSDNRVKFGISTTIHKQNMYDLEQLVVFASQSKARSISFILLDEVGRAKENEDLHLSKEDTHWLSSNIKALRILYADEIPINFLDPINPKYGHDQHFVLSDQIFCSGGTIRCAVASDGAMFPCVYGFDLLETKAGSIIDKSVNSLWNTDLWDDFRGKIKIKDLEACSLCAHVGACYLKNCRLRAKLYNKNILAIPHNCPQAEILCCEQLLLKPSVES